MKRTIDRSAPGVARLGLVMVALSLALSQSVYSDRVGEGTDLFLDPLIDPLSKRNIDVVPGFARDYSFEENSRPRVAKLATFPLDDNPSSRNAEEWMRHFERGAFHYLVAFRPRDPAPELAAKAQESPAFLEAWSKAGESERVFLAFSRRDTDVAKNFAEVLREKGMVVFMYVESKQARPWADPELVGQLFREAGRHYVIDSPGARRSSGVAFEALSLARLKEITKRSQPSLSGRCRDAVRGAYNG